MMQSRSKITRKNILIILIGCLLIGASASYFLFWRNSEKVTTVPSTSAQEDQAAAKKGISQKNNNSEQSSGSDKQAKSSNATSGGVASPQGNFVSSHNVNSLSATIESVCTTTRGASCEITFTRGGLTKSLGKKTIDTNGSATWLWTPASIGLSGGSWEINATAILNSAQSVAKDPRNLEVAL